VNHTETIRALQGEVIVCADPDAIADRVAVWLASACSLALADRGRFTIALSGGSTPRRLFHTLTGDRWRTDFEWQRWHVYFSDERACPPDDENSNYHLVRSTLLDHVPIDPANVYRMRAESPDLDAAAAEYSTLLETTLPRGPSGGPRCDCILLGLGENGHTASLFPGTPALDVTDRWATRGRADYAPFDRITMTFPTINAAAAVALLVTGESKRPALRATGDGTTPASRVLPSDGTLTWFLDRAAAG
jgi:6-phosphogluconolactonase